MVGSSRRGLVVLVVASLFATAVVAVGGPATAAPVLDGADSIGFDDFSDLSGLRLNGVAGAIDQPVDVGGHPSLRVLRSRTNERSSVFWDRPIELAYQGVNSSFSQEFRFRITDLRGSGADGVVFLIGRSPSIIGGSGGGIGYSGINNSVAIEFDTWRNSGDPNANHVGINLNGNAQSVATGTPSANLENGNVWTGWVDYDGATKQLQVRASDDGERPATPLVEATVDIAGEVGQDFGYFGLTSASGAAAETIDVLSWNGTGKFPEADPKADAGPDQSVPEGSVVQLDASGSRPGLLGRPISTRWDLVSATGPAVQLSSTTDERPSFSVFDDGVYTFRVTASDGLASSTDNVVITVNNVAPTLGSVDAGPTATDGLAQVTAVFSDPGVADVHGVRFDWGDGSPPDIVAAQVTGTGWGYGFAGHVYDSTGDKTATVTALDDDGGESAPETVTFNVGDAGEGEAMPGAALWALSAADDAIRVTGSNTAVDGVVHSNGGIEITGSGARFTGGTEYATAISAVGSGPTFDPAPVQTSAGPAPYSFPLADWRPDGAVASGLGGDYHDMTGQCTGGANSRTWRPRGVLDPGVYYVNCAIAVSGSRSGGDVTFVAEKTISVTGSRSAWTPYARGLQFLSASTDVRAIDLAGSHHTFNGALVAEAGGIELTGADNILDCGLVADRIRISGSRARVTGVNCETIASGGPAVAIAAPLVLVPNLDLDVAFDRPVVHPGEEVDFAATVTNGTEGQAATVNVPVQFAADNRGADAVSVTGVSYRLEVHDPVTDEWTVIADTNPGAAPDRQATIVARANPTTDVTYPAADAADQIAGTTIAPGAIASWAAVASIDLTANQLAAILDPARVDAIRNVARIDTDGRLVRRIARFGDDPLGALRAAPGADLANVAVETTRPTAGPERHDQTTTPALSLLPPGNSVVVGGPVPIEFPEPRGTEETGDAYLDRLTGLDDTILVGTAFARADAGVGVIQAPQQASLVTRRLPILRATVSTPSVIEAGTVADFAIEITNTGTAPATALDLTAELDGEASLTVEALPESIAPGQTITVHATSPTTADEVSQLNVHVDLRWSHVAAGADMYGPVDTTTATTARPPIALAATKIAGEQTETLTVFDYTITLHNDGATDLTGIGINDLIDSNLTIVPGSVTTSPGITVTAGNDPGDRTVTAEVDILPSGETASLSFYVDSAASAPGVSKVTNQATITSDQLDPVLTDDPGPSGLADPTITSIHVNGTGTGGTGGTGSTLPGPTPGDCTPGDGATITAPTTLTCTLIPQPGTTATNWGVYLRPAGSASGDPQQEQIATGTGAELNAEIDPTVLSNGAWVLTVTTGGSDGGLSVTETSIIIDGQLKLGRYATTYQDLDVPVAGIPIQVNRTYDTLNRNDPGDFGNGWNLELANFKVQTNRTLGQGPWTVKRECIPNPQFGQMFWLPCFETPGPRFVTVTWPDGRTETFDLKAATTDLFPNIATVTYKGRTGTTSKLAAGPGQGTVAQFNENFYADFFSPSKVWNPTRFTLTAKDGTKYLLDTTSGLIKATDRNNNTVTVTPDGVRSSLGTEIALTRDAQDRITAVTAPDGHTVTYSYDSNGDLVTVDDAGRTTEFIYTDHYLTKATDPTGAPFRRIDYGADGRITAVTDANGNRTEIGIDVGARAQVVTAPDGQATTISTFDDRGNETVRDDIYDGASHQSTWTYSDDGRDQITGRTDPEGRAVIAGYDSKGNVTGFINPAGGGTALTYNDFAQPTTVTDPAGRTTTVTYDGRGNLTRSVDPTGAATALSYDPLGNVTSVKDPVGRSTNFTHTPEGWVKTVTDPAGHVSTRGYDSNGRLLVEIAPATDAAPAASVTYDYDSAGRRTSVTDAEGETTLYTYDDRDDVSTVTDPAGGATVYGRDPVGNVTSVTNPAGAVTQFTYDARNQIATTTGPATAAAPAGATTTYGRDGGGNLSSTTDPLGATTTYLRDLTGQVAAVTAPGAGTTSYTHDAMGQVTKVIDAEGHDTTTAYDLVGQIVAVTDPTGAVTSYDHDSAGRATASTNPAGETTGFAYDAAGQLTGITDPLGEVTIFGYDAAGNQATTTDPLGNTTTTGYDARGRAVSVTDPTDATSTITYDQNGRVTTRTTPDGKTTGWAYDSRGLLTIELDALGYSTTYGYDAAGRQTTEVDRRGETTTSTYDEAGQLTAITDTEDATVSYGYDRAGRQTTVADANGGTRTTGYDAAGNPVTETDALGRISTHTYDLVGNRTATTDARGLTTTFAFDAAGRMSGETRSEGPVTYSYDPAGRRTSTIDATGTTIWAYDAAGQTTGVLSPQGTITYTWDAAGRLATTTRPDGTVTTTYDPTGRIDTVTDPDGGTFGYQWSSDGLLETLQRPNGVDTTYGYDAANRLTDVSHQGPDGPVAAYESTLDANGNRTELEITTPEGTRTEAYTIDGLNRLTEADYGDGTTETFAYDPAGNRTHREATEGAATKTTDYTYDDAGQLTATTGPAGTTAYSYDQAGNLTATTAGEAHSWDSTNRPTSSTVNGVTQIAAYDADGTRVTVDGNPQLWDRASTGLPTLVDDGTATYTHGPGGVLTETNGDTAYALADPLGSTRTLTGPAGTTIGTADYTAYGQTTTTGQAPRHGYTGETTDPTGQIHLRSRDYNPDTGRFTSTDTLQPNAPGTQGWNLYSYTNNNPTTHTDPTGHTVLVGESIILKQDTEETTRTAGPVGLLVRTTITTLAECLTGIPIGTYSGDLISHGLAGFLCAAPTTSGPLEPDPPGPEPDPDCNESLKAGERPLRRVYEHNPKHRATPGWRGGREISRRPRGGQAEWQAILDASVPDGPIHRRGTEPGTGLTVILRRHLVQELKCEDVMYYHGYVPGG